MINGNPERGVPVFSRRDGDLVQGAITAANGGDFWDGFTHGAADGAMWGGIFAFAGAGLRTIQMFRHGVALGENMNRVRMLASSGRQVTYHGMQVSKVLAKSLVPRPQKNSLWLTVLVSYSE